MDITNSLLLLATWLNVLMAALLCVGVFASIITRSRPDRLMFYVQTLTIIGCYAVCIWLIQPQLSSGWIVVLMMSVSALSGIACAADMLVAVFGRPDPAIELLSGHHPSHSDWY